MRLVSIFALIPFLWLVLRAGKNRAALTGLFLALSYGFVSLPVFGVRISVEEILKLLILCLIFVSYSLIVNGLKRRAKLDIVLVALLWLPLEYVLRRFGWTDGLWPVALADSDLFLRIASLFGVLTISFGIVLTNFLIIVFIGRILGALPRRPVLSTTSDSEPIITDIHIPSPRQWFKFPDVRDPPLPVISI